MRRMQLTPLLVCEPCYPYLRKDRGLLGVFDGLDLLFCVQVSLN